MKKIALIILASLPATVFGEIFNCGEVSITQILTGPKYGAMIRVSNEECGGHGWVCLDPDGEFTSVENSNRTFTFALAYHLSNKPIQLKIDTAKVPTACRGYPAIDDLRTPAQ